MRAQAAEDEPGDKDQDRAEPASLRLGDWLLRPCGPRVVTRVRCRRVPGALRRRAGGAQSGLLPSWSVVVWILPRSVGWSGSPGELRAPSPRGLRAGGPCRRGWRPAPAAPRVSPRPSHTGRGHHGSTPFTASTGRARCAFSLRGVFPLGPGGADDPGRGREQGGGPGVAHRHPLGVDAGQLGAVQVGDPRRTRGGLHHHPMHHTAGRPTGKATSVPRTAGSAGTRPSSPHPPLAGRLACGPAVAVAVGGVLVGQAAPPGRRGGCRTPDSLGAAHRASPAATATRTAVPIRRRAGVLALVTSVRPADPRRSLGAQR